MIARLCASRSPFATVVAPAGYGKTTLLAQWAEADARQFAWVALDSGDDDAVVLLRHVAAAIHRVEPLPPGVFDALSGPGGSTWTNRVPRVGGALARLERPLVLVLDDLHAVSNPACLDVARGAARTTCRPGRRSRSPAGRCRSFRWRAGGREGWWTRSACRTSGWTSRRRSCSLDAAGVELDASALTDLTERTEGWPAGLYLAALSLQAGAPSPAGRRTSAATTGS